MKLIDIHNHIIYGIDDGAKTKQDTIDLLTMAVNDGIEKIIVTPHYREGYFENTKSIIQQKKSEINALIEEHQFQIEIYFGSEIFLTNESLNQVNEGLLQTMNDTQYVLLETHRMKLYSSATFNDHLYNFRVDGYRPIIAHPERYEMVKDNLDIVKQWIDDGCYIQLNTSSLVKSKRPSYKVAKKLLDENLVHFIASDAHDINYRPPVLSEAYQLVAKQYGTKYADSIFYENPMHLLSNKRIKAVNPHFKKKRFFFF